MQERRQQEKVQKLAFFYLQLFEISSGKFFVSQTFALFDD